MIKRLKIVFTALFLASSFIFVAAASAYDPLCPTQDKGKCTSGACQGNDETPLCQQAKAQDAKPGNPNPVAGPSGVINKAANIIALVTGIGAVIMILIGGFFYVTSAGNTENATKAKARITSALIGLVVVALAWVLVRLVTDHVLSTNTSTGTSPVDQQPQPKTPYRATIDQADDNNVGDENPDAPHAGCGGFVPIKNYRKGTALAAACALPEKKMIHAIYAVPSDFILKDNRLVFDRAYDTDGTIASWVNDWNNWFFQLTGSKKKFRLDTIDGKLDVMFVILKNTNDEVKKNYNLIQEGVESYLKSNNQYKNNKLYITYYDGDNNFSCGWSYEPGNFPIVALRQTTGYGGVVQCEGGAKLTSLHEVIHALGFVEANCSNNSLPPATSGHVSDSVTDLMWTSTKGGSWDPQVLDFNNDDYYKTGLKCPDLNKVAWLSVK